MRQITPKRQIERFLSQELERREQAMIRLMSYVAEACLTEARTNGNYKDRTGNLRSSIGYLILKNGRIIESSEFEKVGDGKLGVSEGKKFIKEQVKKFPQGIVLIVVAGMKYAACVEARNFNVLTSSELLAQELVPRMLKRLGFTAA